MKQTKLRKIRQEKGWSRRFVGDYCGISKTAIHDIEIGKQKPSYDDVLVKLEILFKKNMIAC